MTLRPTQPVKIQWDQGPAGTKSYNIVRNGTKVASTKTGLSTQITLASGDDVKIVAQPSGQAQELTITWAVPTPPPPPPPSTNPVPPPSSGVYFGAYIEGAQTYGYYFPAKAPWSNAPVVDPGTSDPWVQFETDAGKKVAMLMFGEDNFFAIPGDFDENFAATRAKGAIPVVDVQTQPGLGTLADIAAGKYDTKIVACAKGAATLGPFVLRIDAEMNGGWYDFGKEIRALNAANPGSGNTAFVGAWRKIHDLFRANGASNVSFHWCPNVDPENTQTPLEALYPGDAYVDWAGMTGYEEGGETVEWVFGSTYARITALTAKPIMIGETGALDAGYPGLKVTSINDFFSKMQSEWPQIRAFCWFNWRTNENNPPWDWPIESSAAGLAAFQAAVASPYIVGR